MTLRLLETRRQLETRRLLEKIRYVRVHYIVDQALKIFRCQSWTSEDTRHTTHVERTVGHSHDGRNVRICTLLLEVNSDLD